MPVTLVTGSEGFVGPYLVNLLLEEGYEVFGMDLRSGEDIRDYERVRTTIDQIRPDYIFHLAAQAYVPEGITDVRRCLDVNVTGTLNLLEAVRHTGLRPHILLAGTSEEYGYDQPGPLTEDSPTLPTTPYGVSKLAAGHLGLVYARTYGLNVVITRAFNHTGPGHPPAYAIPSFAKRVADVRKGRLDKVVHGNLESVRNYTDVRDMVRAYLMAIQLESGIYNVCSDRTVSMQWVLDNLVELSGGEVQTELSDSLYRPMTGNFPEPSSEKLRSLTGWQPQITLEETLSDVLAYWGER